MVETRVCSPEILDVGRVLDQEDNVWEKGYQTFYRRTKQVKAINAESFSEADIELTSALVFCAPYTEVAMMGKFTGIVGTFGGEGFIEASNDRVNFYRDEITTGFARSTIQLDTSDFLSTVIFRRVPFPWLRVFFKTSGVGAGESGVITIELAFSS